MSSELVARIDTHSLELATPLVTSRGTTSNREIVLVEVQTPDGLSGWGEAAPLPGWPGPDLDEVTRSLRQWVASGFSDVPTGGPARAAVDSAMLDIAAQRAGVPLSKLLHPGATGEVAVNALVDAIDPEVVEIEAAAAARGGFGTIKLKVASSEHDIDRVASARRGAPEARLRLDANRGMDAETAVTFCRAVHGFDIEFIEEPIGGGVPALRLLQSQVPVPVAADESLSELPVADYRTLDLDVLVVKPSAIGHLEILVSLAESHRLVVTSFLDSAVGVTMALHVAAAATAVKEGEMPACGLATSSRLRADTAPAPEFQRGSLIVPTTTGLGAVPNGAGPTAH